MPSANWYSKDVEREFSLAAAVMSLQSPLRSRIEKSGTQKPYAILLELL
jgi:hypothetical protein